MTSASQRLRLRRLLASLVIADPALRPARQSCVKDVPDDAMSPVRGEIRP